MVFNMYVCDWAPTSHVGGKTLIIPGTVSFQLHFIGKGILVFWKLSLEDFFRYIGQQYPTRGISSGSGIFVLRHLKCVSAK